jgi:hypothetical protein
MALALLLVGFWSIASDASENVAGAREVERGMNRERERE